VKAAVLRKIGQPLCIEDIPVPEIAADEVLVETRTCGICRTDLHIQDGLAYVPELPHVPGHEPAGVVAAVGGSVDNFEVGQRVVPYLFVTCGQCRYCQAGRDAQCSHVSGILGVTRSGAFAEYFVAPARNLLILPDNVDFSVGGLVSCAVITAVHAYRRARLSKGDVAIVIGAGGIGRLLVQILNANGVRAVAVSRSAQNLRLAEQAGAELTLPLAAPDTAARLSNFTGGEGAACAFDCVGTAATMKLSADVVGRGGQIVVIGEEPEFPEINTIQIAQRELEIIGSRNGSRQDAADAVAMMASGAITPQIVARYPLDQINEALDYVRSGQSHGRVIVDIS